MTVVYLDRVVLLNLAVDYLLLLATARLAGLPLRRGRLALAAALLLLGGLFLSPALGLHLLMAEDNELNREIAVTLLEEQGAAITTAENGREAVELFQNAPQGTFDAVLMDVMMPEMNGLEATRAIRAFEHCPPESGIPIIAMTANVFADDVKACLEAGMNSHVGKPLDMQVLAAEICRQMRRHTALLESADFTKLGN